MAIAQGLYQNGYITYHRTDSPGLSDQALNAARKEVEELCGADYLQINQERMSLKARVPKKPTRPYVQPAKLFAHPKNSK